MKRICARCSREQAAAEPLGGELLKGLCAACTEEFAGALHRPLLEFLDTMDVPILVVDDRVRVVAGNRLLLNMTGMPVERVRGLAGGDVMECVNAAEPEGCGNTVHCNGCAIRQSVTHTFQTGATLTDIPAYLDRRRPDGESRTFYLISTEKVADKVLLQIEEIDELAYAYDG